MGGPLSQISSGGAVHSTPGSSGPKNSIPVSNSAAGSASLSSASGGGTNHNNTNVTLSETTEVAATTTFVNDGSEKVQDVRPVTLDSSMAVAKTDDNSIALFMSKPVAIYSSAWSSSSVSNAILASFNISDYVFGSSVPNIWKNKLSGYNLVRGKCVFKVVLNSQPFQAGRLLVHFLPQFQQFNAHSSAYNNMHNWSLTTKTQQPCVEMDIQDGAATIKIPYIAPTLWLSRDVQFDWGTVFLTVLSPLASASSTTVNYVVYMYFEDFELAGPIFGPEMNALSAIVTDNWNNAKKERSATKDSGVVTTFFDFLKKPADLLTSVPVIGGVAGEVSKVLGSIGNFTSYFGWSRPYDVKGTQIVKQHNFYRGFNFNGTTTADVLAMDSMNQLAPMTNFAGSDLDEMSFSYLKQIPALIADFSWSTSATANTNLYALEASPFNCHSTISKSFPTSGTQPVNSYAPFAYLARYFRYYRGSIVVTLKFVKTQYHSGRLAVTFTPSTNNVPTTSEGRAYVYRDIIDLRESDTFSFTLPYMHPAPFLNTGFYRTETLTETDFGTFRVDVLNPLIAASTVSSSIDALVYVNAADDFQLTALQPTKSYAFYPQMNTDIPRISGTVGDAPKQPDSIVPSALCVGELFTSVKQLYASARPINFGFPGVVSDGDQNSFPGASFGANGGLYGFAICPYYPGTVESNNVGLDTTVGPLSQDYISELSVGFAYSRGGVRISWPEAVTSNQSVAWLDIAPSGSSTPVISAFTSSYLPATRHQGSNITSVLTSMFPMAVRNTIASICDIIVPAYGQTPFRLNYPISALFPYVPTTMDSPDYVANVSFNQRQAVPGSALDHAFGSPFRSGADDFATGYFIGFPPTIEFADS